MQKNNQPVSQEKFKTLIGGQALIEGILMQGPDKRAIVVRGPEGLVQKVEPIKKKTGILTCMQSTSAFALTSPRIQRSPTMHYCIPSFGI